MIITIGSKVKDGEGNTYTLTEELGHGGFGCVYKAECEADKSVYAVKTLLYSFGDEATAASFKNEVKISSEVSGEHVIHYIYAHDGDEYPELPPYIIMEYAEGGTLADQIEERKKTNSPYSKEELRNLFLQLVDGMKYINKKLVHRYLFVMEYAKLLISDLQRWLQNLLEPCHLRDMVHYNILLLKLGNQKRILFRWIFTLWA